MLDRGSGISRRLHKDIFRYLYTTAPDPVAGVYDDDDDDGAGNDARDQLDDDTTQNRDPTKHGTVNFDINDLSFCRRIILEV